MNHELQLRQLSKAEISKLAKENMDIICDNIIAILKKRNIQQRELAYAIESTPPHLNYILKKRKGMTTNVLIRISAALNVKVCELTGN